MTHGTMLPSTIPLSMNDVAAYPGTKVPDRHFGKRPDGDDGPRRISSGTHDTITKKNTTAAARYARVRQNLDLIRNYWETVGSSQQ